MQGTPGRGRGLTVDFSEDVPTPSSFYPRSRRSVTPPNQKLRSSSHMKLAANFGSDQVQQKSPLANWDAFGMPGSMGHEQQLRNMVQDFGRHFEQKQHGGQNQENWSPPLNVRPVRPREGQFAFKHQQQQHQQQRMPGQIKILKRPQNSSTQISRHPYPQMHPVQQMIQEQEQHGQPWLRQHLQVSPEQRAYEGTFTQQEHQHLQQQQKQQQFNKHLQMLSPERRAYDEKLAQQQVQQQQQHEQLQQHGESCSGSQQLQQQGQHLQEQHGYQGEQQEKSEQQQQQLQQQDQHMQQKGSPEKQTFKGEPKQKWQGEECQQQQPQQQQHQQQQQQQEEHQQQQQQQEEFQQPQQPQQQEEFLQQQQQQPQQKQQQQKQLPQQDQEQQNMCNVAKCQPQLQMQQDQQYQLDQERQNLWNATKLHQSPLQGQEQQQQQQRQQLQQQQDQDQQNMWSPTKFHQSPLQGQQQQQQQQQDQMKQFLQQQHDPEQQNLWSVTKQQPQLQEQQQQHHSSYQQKTKSPSKQQQQKQKEDEQNRPPFKGQQHQQQRQLTGKNHQQQPYQQDFHTFSNETVHQATFPGITSPTLPDFSPNISPPLLPPNIASLLPVDTSKPPPPLGFPIPGLPNSAQLGPLPTQLWTPGAPKQPLLMGNRQDSSQPHGRYPTKTRPLNDQRSQRRTWERVAGGDNSAFAAMQEKSWDDLPLGGGYASGGDGYQSPQVMCPSSSGEVPTWRKERASPLPGDPTQQKLARDGTQGQKQWQKKDKPKRRGNNKQDPRGIGTHRANSPSQPDGSSNSTKALQESSNLSKEEAKNEYDWRSFKIVRKVRKVLGVLKDGGATASEKAATEIVTIMKEESSRLASYPWPKEQFVVLDEVLGWVMDHPEMVKNVCKLIQEMQCQHPENFQVDLINTMMKRHAQFIKVSSATNKKKLYSSYSSILGNLFILSQSANKNLKETTVKLMDLLVSKWMMCDVQNIDKEQLMLIEVYAFCLRALFAIIGPRLDSETDQKYNEQLRDQVLGNQPRIVKEAMLDLLLMRATGWKSSAEVKTESSENIKVTSTDDAWGAPQAEGDKSNAENDQLPKKEPAKNQSKEVQERSTLSENISGSYSGRSREGSVSMDNLASSMTTYEATKTDLDQTNSSKSQAKDSLFSGLQNGDIASSMHTASAVTETTDKFKLPDKEVAERGAIVLNQITTQQSFFPEDMGDGVPQQMIPYNSVPTQVYAGTPPPDPWPAMYVSAFSEMQAELSASAILYQSGPLNVGPAMPIPNNPLQDTDVSCMSQYPSSSPQVNLGQPTNVEFAVPFMPFSRSPSSAFIPGRPKVPHDEVVTAQSTPAPEESYLKPPEAFSKVRIPKMPCPNTDVEVDACSTSKPKSDGTLPDAASFTRQELPGPSVLSSKSTSQNSQTSMVVHPTTTVSSLNNARPTPTQNCTDSEISQSSQKAETKQQNENITSTQPLPMSNKNNSNNCFKDKNGTPNYRQYSPEKELHSQVNDDPTERTTKEIQDVQPCSTGVKGVFKGMSQHRIDHFWEEESDSTISECEQPFHLAPLVSEDPSPVSFNKSQDPSQGISLKSCDLPEDFEQEPESRDMKGKFSPSLVTKSQSCVGLGRGMIKRENGSSSIVKMCGISEKCEGHGAENVAFEHPRDDVMGYPASTRPLPGKPDGLESNAFGPSLIAKAKTNTNTDLSAFIAPEIDISKGSCPSSDSKASKNSPCHEKWKDGDGACEERSPSVAKSRASASKEKLNENPFVYQTSPLRGQNSSLTTESQKISVVCPLCGSKNHRTRQCAMFKKFAPRAKSSEIEPEPKLETQEVQKPKAISEFGKRIFCSKCRKEGHLNYDCPVGGGFNIFQ